MGNYMTIVRGLTLSVSLVSIFTVLVVTVLKVIGEKRRIGGQEKRPNGGHLDYE